MVPDDGINLIIPSEGHVDPKAAHNTLKTVLSLEEVKNFMNQKSDVQGIFFFTFPFSIPSSDKLENALSYELVFSLR